MAATPAGELAARIQRLAPDVVNRIAAGEVIHRPANALKELLENSLDAQATQISVTVGQGGLKLLQIQDNGKGIHREDLAIVCERFTTSKLRVFEDLRAISSFGFRGEALASISHVAHVSITSKTATQPCAYKCVIRSPHYRDGKLIAKQPGGSADPVPCAGKIGTTIVVEDLFYNLSTRRQALKNASEQYQRIVDVVQRYAVHFGDRGVGFVCKKHREVSCDVTTLHASSQLDVIRQIFGSKVSNELIEFSYRHEPTTLHRDLEFTAHAWVSNANYSLKSSNFILFINDRLVDCAPLKKACELVYSLYLPKHTHPFVYMSLQMPPQNLDVNVHPTKREVHFLYEELIVEALAKHLEIQLKGSNQSRVFTVQPISSMMAKSDIKGKDRSSATLAGGAGFQQQAVADSDDDDDDKRDDTGENKQLVDAKQPSRRRAQDNDNDGQAWASEEEETKDDGEDDAGDSQVSQSIEIDLTQKSTPNSKKYNPSKSQSTDISNQHDAPRSSGEELSGGDAGDEDRRRAKKRRRLSQRADDYDEPESEDSASSPKARRESVVPATQSPQMLTSVKNVLHHIELRKSNALTKVLFREHSFVGVVNRDHSLVQYRTKLYLVRHRDVAYHLFYERIFQQFGCLESLQVPTPLPVYDLVLEALENPRIGFDEEDGPKEQLAKEIQELMAANGPMLAEYFALDIDSQGRIRTLPRLLVDHEPSLHSLPEFVFRLATDVNWEEEQPCFEGVAQALAQWYSELWYPMQPEQSALVLEHVVFPATKSSPSSPAFSPPHELNDTTVLRPIACLTKLYRIFERC
ncbi:hypothetical protein P43SY_002750 [Pythium insidiosum]|uniref:DNA mismatch repair protein S5 domain-containing protein n=1 Tax=Pythium insidiosum TaxID=114742 RepID=A0AAD5MCJ3_PYTIN|nr:hypothetical protein P43SY_002750 [Pythium insidiosum]